MTSLKQIKYVINYSFFLTFFSLIGLVIGQDVITNVTY